MKEYNNILADIAKINLEQQTLLKERRETQSYSQELKIEERLLKLRENEKQLIAQYYLEFPLTVEEKTFDVQIKCNKEPEGSDEYYSRDLESLLRSKFSFDFSYEGQPEGLCLYCVTETQLDDILSKIDALNTKYPKIILGNIVCEIWENDIHPLEGYTPQEYLTHYGLYQENKMLTNEEIADNLLSDLDAYRDNIRDIIIGRLMDSSAERTSWDAWFRGATGEALELAKKCVVYNPKK